MKIDCNHALTTPWIATTPVVIEAQQVVDHTNLDSLGILYAYQGYMKQLCGPRYLVVSH